MPSGAQAAEQVAKRAEGPSDSASAQSAVETAVSPRAPRAFPSIGGLLFIITLATFTVGPWAHLLLSDADTGWHIRNGEHILLTHSVPHADYFSYTKAGEPWYAWEWLFDVLLGVIHRHTGLYGVIALAALLIASVVGLTFHMAVLRSHDVLLSAGMTSAAVVASSVHALARPHLVTWLFLLIYVQLLEAEVTWRRVLAAILVMAAWANLHGGFIFGIALLVIYFADACWTVYRGGPDIRASRTRRRRIGVALVLASAITLANPYGFALHRHIVGMLTSRFLMAATVEFRSPDFHLLASRAFELLAFLAVLAITYSGRRVPLRHALLVLFALYIGLIAVRNLPLASFLLVVIITPYAAELLDRLARVLAPERSVGRLCRRFRAFSARMARVEIQKRIHWPEFGAGVLAMVLAMHGGKVAGRQLQQAEFDPAQYPVGAGRYLSAHGVRKGVYAPDYWGGFLVYDSGIFVFADGRVDFYDEEFLQDYLKVLSGTPGWRDVLNRYDAEWALVPPDSSTISVLSLSPEWKEVYRDKTAVVFKRSEDLHDPAVR